MPSASSEEQFKFLISCVRWSISGKVDFGEVAKECNIVSKGAAAKRYERMMKAHGISTTGTTIRTVSSSRIIRTEPKGSPSSKKRKMDAFKEENSAGEDDPEHFDDIKTEQGNGEEELRVKEEPNIQQISTSMNGDNAPMSIHSHQNTAFLSGPGMYESKNAYNMVVNSSNVYDLGDQPPRSHPNFFAFSGYEPTDTVHDTATTRQAPHEPILINDSD